LKGAARAVGLPPIERVLHRLENIYTGFRRTGSPPAPAAIAAGSKVLDFAEDVLASALGERAQPDEQSLLRLLDQVEGVTSRPEQFTVPEMPAEAGARPAPRDNLVRTHAETLDSIVRIAGQLVTVALGDNEATERAEEQASLIDDTARNYQRLRQACTPLVSGERADPSFAPVDECFRYIDGQLNALASGSRRVRLAQQRSSWRLRQHIEELRRQAGRARMSPAEAVLGNFGPVVRGIAEHEGKEVVFTSEGLDVQADRAVLQALKDPVMHLVRNAVSHGIEAPAARSAAVKPAAGSVHLGVALRGDRLRVTVQDDGAGMNMEALAREAARQGLDVGPAPEAARRMLLSLAMQPGFTTAKDVSEVSGRGLGLAIVKEAASRLRGTVSVDSGKARGTKVEISVPVTIATEHVLLVREGGGTYALPAGLVEAIRIQRRDDIQFVDGRACVMAGQAPTPLVRLSELLGVTRAPAEAEDANGRTFPVVLARASVGVVSVAVDRVIDNRDVLVRETGLSQEQAGLSIGAVTLEDGSVAVLLSLGDMLDAFLGSPAPTGAFAAPAEEQRKPLVLVVDDSITTRSVERNILEAHGYQVELAVDGLEALEKVRRNRPDLVISDVAMPRMDGFELLEKLKAGKDTESIPVILVTSLEKREEQERGLSLGADAYIVKRKFDQRDLLATVRQIL
jgi:two-component system chemotaxis sensor kinase CheA